MTDVFALWRWQYLWNDRMVFIKGLWTTIIIAAGGLMLALLLGFTFGLMATSRNKITKSFARVYLEIFRNIPLTLQVLFIYYSFIYSGVKISPTIVGIMALGLCIGALISEIVRGGIEAIPKGQYEAAAAQGLTTLQTMRIVVLPQMIKIIMPPLATQLAVLVLNTCVLQMIAGNDLMYVTSNWVANGTLSYGPAYLVCGLLFFAVCYPITSMARRQERLHLGTRR